MSEMSVWVAGFAGLFLAKYILFIYNEIQNGENLSTGY